MTAKSAKSAWATISTMPPLADVDMTLTAIAPDQDGPWSGFRIKLTTAAKQAIAEAAEMTRKQLGDATLLEYGPAVLVPPQHWMHVADTDAATLGVIESVVGKQDLKPFDGDAPYAQNLKLIAARFTTGDQRSVTFYRVADSLLQLKKSKMIGLLQQGGVYGRLEAADVLLLRPEFDVIVIDGRAFFHKKPTFERAFGFLSELKKESLSTFNAVTSKLKVEGFDALREACTTQPQMMAKMASIKRSMDSDPDYAKAMTMPKLIKYIETHPQVKINILGGGSNRKLVFDPKPQRRFQIVKLLDDDFLRSVLTDREYEAGSKVQAQGQ